MKTSSTISKIAMGSVASEYGTLHAVLVVAALGCGMSGCAGEVGDATDEELGSTAEELIWSQTRSAPFSNDSPDVVNGGFGNSRTGEFGADANGAFAMGEGHDGWIEQTYTVPSYITRAVRYSADVRILGGHVTLASPLGGASAGAWIRMSVLASDGSELCATQRDLARDTGFAEHDIAVSTPPLSCSVVASGAIRVRVNLRAWVDAGGLAGGRVGVRGRLNSTLAVLDSGPEDFGDVVVTDLSTSRNTKIHDFFCIPGERCDVGWNMGRPSIVAAGPNLLTFLDSGVVFSARRSGAFPFMATDSRIIGSDVCRSGERCLIGDVNDDGRDDVFAVAGDGTANVSISRVTGELAARLPQSVLIRDLNPLDPRPRLRNLCGQMACELADVNADGHADVVAFNRPASSSSRPPLVSINSAGTFSTPLSAFVVGDPNASLCRNRACVVKDINEDGGADLVDFGAPDGVRVAFSDRVSAFAAATRVLTDFCNASDDCQISDVDGDGDGDLVALTHDAAGTVRISHFRGGAVFDPPFTRPSVCTGSRVCKMQGGLVIAFTR